MKMTDQEYNEQTEVFSLLYRRKIHLEKELEEIEVKILESIRELEIGEKEIQISNEEFNRKVELVLGDPRFTGNRLAAEQVVKATL